MSRNWTLVIWSLSNGSLPVVAMIILLQAHLHYFPIVVHFDQFPISKIFPYRGSLAPSWFPRWGHMSCPSSRGKWPTLVCWIQAAQLTLFDVFQGGTCAPILALSLTLFTEFITTIKTVLFHCLLFNVLKPRQQAVSAYSVSSCVMCVCLCQTWYKRDSRAIIITLMLRYYANFVTSRSLLMSSPLAKLYF